MTSHRITRRQTDAVCATGRRCCVRQFAWLASVVLTCVLTRSSGAGTVTLIGDFARAYETEMGLGTLTEALQAYRRALPEASSADPPLAGKILYRIGACEKELGHIPECRQAWQQLVDLLPADHPLAVRARKEIKDLERELERVTVAGRIVDEAGVPIASAYVMVGGWGTAPPVLTGTDGVFRVERQSAGRLSNGRRYCLVYSEHPDQPRVGAGVWSEAATPLPSRNGTDKTGVDMERNGGGRRARGKGNAIEVSDFTLHPAITLTGFVVDPNGRPVPEASVHVTGFAGRSGDIVMPLGNILAPTMTDHDGHYSIRGLAEGVRYVVTAEKAGYRPGKEGGTYALDADAQLRVSGLRTSLPSDGTVHANELVLVPSGHIFVDETGLLQAEVNLNDAAERARLESMLARFKSDQPETRARISWHDPVVGPVSAFPFADYPFALRWLQCDVVAGRPPDVTDLVNHIAVYHFGSAYLESSLKGLFPGEAGTLSQAARVYGHHGVLFAWVLPASDDADDAVQLALETCTEMPIALDREGHMWKALGVTGYGGNVVVDRRGTIQARCTDMQLFRVIRDVLTDDHGSGDVARPAGGPVRPGRERR